MKAALVTATLVLTALAALTLWSRSPEREARALRHFTAEEVARGRRHALERRAIFWAGQAVELAVLVALVHWAPRLVQACGRLAGQRFALTLLGVAAACFLAQELASFPIGLYGGLYHERAWGLTDRSLGSWLSDHAKELLVGAAIGLVLTFGLYGLLRTFPRSWWALATAGAAAFAVFLAFVAPLWIAPLFNTFTPLRDTRHAALLPRVLAMAEASKLPVREVLVMDASRQGRHTNAYFAGFGSTRRIVLYDTLLDSHTPDEVVSVLGHEMGHWRNHHVVKGIALGTAGALLGFFVLARLLEAAAGGGFGFAAPSEPGSLPLILLLAYLGGWIAAPVEAAVSRRFERQADRAALELGGDPSAFVEAEKRLARDNILNVAPADLNVWLFATHPPTLERIEMAEAWAVAGR